MNASSIITLVIFLATAAMMISIGISNLRSKTPVGFYTGEKPPKAEELTDVKAWNKKHGIMWISYGVIIIVSDIIGNIIGDSIYCLIPFCGGAILPIIFMIWYHERMVKKYKK